MEYLFHEKGRPEWAAAADRAERYQTFRDATREAMRLPSTLRAFALPAED
jgi:hypothetical protein